MNAVDANNEALRIARAANEQLRAERDRYRELFEAKYSTIRAERDCYREALDTIARMDNGVSVSRPFSDAPTIARAALHPEEEE